MYKLLESIGLTSKSVRYLRKATAPKEINKKLFIAVSSDEVSFLSLQNNYSILPIVQLVLLFTIIYVNYRFNRIFREISYAIIIVIK